jgi:hypothetical protein
MIVTTTRDKSKSKPKPERSPEDDPAGFVEGLRLKLLHLAGWKRSELEQDLGQVKEIRNRVSEDAILKLAWMLQAVEHRLRDWEREFLYPQSKNDKANLHHHIWDDAGRVKRIREKYAEADISQDQWELTNDEHPGSMIELELAAEGLLEFARTHKEGKPRTRPAPPPPAQVVPAMLSLQS